MAIIIDPNPVPIGDDPNPMVGPAGSHFVSAVSYPEFFELQDGEDVFTLQCDFLSPTEISPATLRGAMDDLRNQGILNSELILAYSLWQASESTIVVPDQICVLGYCWTPPWAGETVLSTYTYRLWILSKGFFAFPSSVRVRPAGALLVLALVALLTVGVAMIAGIIAMNNGSIKWKDIKDFSKDILLLPGENIARAEAGLAWPMVAFGIAMVAGAIVLPIAISRATVGIHAGPVQATLGGEFGRAGGPAAVTEPRKRK